MTLNTLEKENNSSFKDFFGKCEKIHNFLLICLDFPETPLNDNSIYLYKRNSKLQVFWEIRWQVLQMQKFIRIASGSVHVLMRVARRQPETLLKIVLHHRYFNVCLAKSFRNIYEGLLLSCYSMTLSLAALMVYRRLKIY